MDVRSTSFENIKLAVTADPTLLVRLIKNHDERGGDGKITSKEKGGGGGGGTVTPPPEDDGDGVTMLWQACALGMVEMAEFLMHFKVKITQNDLNRIGKEEIGRLLNTLAPSQSPSEEQQEWAAVEASKIIGAIGQLNPNSASSEGFIGPSFWLGGEDSALSSSSSSSSSPSLFIFSDVDFRRPRGLASCLYIAAQNGHLAIVNMLIRRGANVNLARDTNATPLFIATQRNNLPIVEALLNAQYTQRERAKQIMAAEVKRDGHHDSEQDDFVGDQDDDVSSPPPHLLPPPIDVDAKNSQHCTPFVLACSMGHTEIAMLLLQHGADHENKATGLTGLQWAKREKRRETFLILLQSVFLPEMNLRFLFQLWRVHSQTMKVIRRRRIEAAEEEHRSRLITVECDGERRQIELLMAKERTVLDRLLGNTFLTSDDPAELGRVQFVDANLRRDDLVLLATDNASVKIDYDDDHHNDSHTPPNHDALDDEEDQKDIFGFNSKLMSRTVSFKQQGEVVEAEKVVTVVADKKIVEKTADAKTVTAKPSHASTASPSSLRYWYLNKNDDDKEEAPSPPSAARGSGTSKKTNLEYFSPCERKIVLQKHLRACAAAASATAADRQQQHHHTANISNITAGSSQHVDPLRGKYYSHPRDHPVFGLYSPEGGGGGGGVSPSRALQGSSPHHRSPHHHHPPLYINPDGSFNYSLSLHDTDHNGDDNAVGGTVVNANLHALATATFNPLLLDRSASSPLSTRAVEGRGGAAATRGGGRGLARQAIECEAMVNRLSSLRIGGVSASSPSSTIVVGESGGIRSPNPKAVIIDQRSNTAAAAAVSSANYFEQPPQKVPSVNLLASATSGRTSSSRKDGELTSLQYLTFKEGMNTSINSANHGGGGGAAAADYNSKRFDLIQQLIADQKQTELMLEREAKEKKAATMRRANDEAQKNIRESRLFSTSPLYTSEELKAPPQILREIAEAERWEREGVRLARERIHHSKRHSNNSAKLNNTTSSTAQPMMTPPRTTTTSSVRAADNKGYSLSSSSPLYSASSPITAVATPASHFASSSPAASHSDSVKRSPSSALTRKLSRSTYLK